MPTPAKEALVQEVQSALERASSAILVDYRGLTHKELEDLRQRLRDRGATFQVVKNTLLRLALKNTGRPLLEDLTEGPTAVAFGFEDAGATAKVLLDFARDHAELEFKGGLLGTDAFGPDGVRQLSEMPTREQMLGQLVGLLNAPLSIFTQLGSSGLGTILALQALREQKEAA